MSSTTIITLAVAVLAVLGLAVVLTASRRSDVGGTGSLSRETRKRDRSIAKKAKSSSQEVESQAFASRGSSLAVMPPPEIEKWVAPDTEALGETRRAFLNRATVTLMSASLGGFAAALIAFLWKGAEGGFGSKISVGKIDDVIGQIRSARGFLYLPEARSWVTEYPKEAISKAEVAYGGQGAVFSGMNAGIVALYQKCPHLGCRVPECSTSQWFECPCHGSQYNRVGEKKGGPAPRGMDRFGVSVNNGVLVIDTGTVFGGPPIGTNTTGQEAEGP
ncbi:MAG: ubiquinol-cytochrome c reductase iron-sulfur subunit, partial [Acidimicrobiaceae bacterium]|nr:ubiquinol-cytochrome c reductase iron-sulfur subunit [Acidimicrobiaceae bacterium]